MFSKVDKKLKIANLAENISEYQLSNGLKVYLHKNNNFTKCYANYMVDYGSNMIDFIIGEKEYSLPKGIAHFLEHVMFQTKDKGDYFDLYSDLGTSSNAYTSYTQTSYIFSATDNIKENLKILIEQTQTLTIDEEAVKKEQGIIVEELQMYMQRPNYIFRKKMYENITASNYKYDILGDESSITSMSLEDLMFTFNTFYAPSNSILFISGNIGDDVIEYLESIQIVKENKKLEIIDRNKKESYVSKEISHKYSDKNSHNDMKMYVIKYPPLTNKKDEIKMDITIELLETYMCSYINKIYEENMNSNMINFSLSINSHFHEDLSLVYLNITDNVEFDIKKFYIDSLNSIDKEDFEILYNKKISEEIRVFNDPEYVVESSIGILNRKIDIEEYYSILKEYNVDDYMNNINLLKEIKIELNLFLEKNKIKQ